MSSLAIWGTIHELGPFARMPLMVNLGLLDRDADSPTLMRSHTANMKRIATEVLDNLHAAAVKLRPDLLDHLGPAARQLL